MCLYIEKQAQSSRRGQPKEEEEEAAPAAKCVP